jgi:hypothetical protein
MSSEKPEENVPLIQQNQTKANFCFRPKTARQKMHHKLFISIDLYAIFIGSTCVKLGIF